MPFFVLPVDGFDVAYDVELGVIFGFVPHVGEGLPFAFYFHQKPRFYYIPIRFWFGKIGGIIEIFDQNSLIREVQAAIGSYGSLLAFGHPHKAGFVGIIGKQRRDQFVRQNTSIGLQIALDPRKKTVVRQFRVRRFVWIKLNGATHFHAFFLRSRALASETKTQH